MTSGILYDAVYVPRDSVNVQRVAERFSRKIYEDKACERCPHAQDRHCYMCDECPAYKGNYILFKSVRIKGVRYITFPRGAVKALMDLAPKDLSLEDRRVTGERLPRDMQVTGTLWKHQISVITQVLGGAPDPETNKVRGVTGSVNGIIKAPPRTGKTLIVLTIAVSLGCKTLILAHQEELLKQFIDDIKLHTNFDDVAFSEKRPMYGICKTVADFERYPIALSTYQQFISSNGASKLQQIKKLFGLICVDESHRTGADCYARVVAAFPAKHRLGVTATPDRKDLKHFVTEDVIGNVIASVSADTMTPTVAVHKTGFAPKYKYKTWSPAIRWLADHKERQQLIVDYAIRDLENGHSLVIPVTFVHQSKSIADAINEEWAIDHPDEVPIAVAFHGKANREDILKGARLGKYRAVVGIRSIISVGVNVPRWSCLYVIAPISNPPNFEQETRRICTVMEGKRKPLIRMFVDEMDLTKGCFRTCWWQTFVKLKFDVSESTREKAKKILGGGRSRGTTDEFSVHRANLNAPVKTRHSLFEM